ncbi:glycosyltransferase [Altericista sp. CCNU0014]|uniref:glycosyltransferase n=1 Tax=Altericista sp. CCNU0014 TaxID=3082949 RepID=UPI00384F33E3
MTRLLIVATVPETVRGFLLPWAERYRAKGWTVDAMARGISSCPACVGAFNQVWDVKWSRNPLNPLNFVAAPQRLRAIARSYDIVHVHTPVAAFVTRFALRELRRQGKLKAIYTAHGFHFHRNGSRLRNGIFLTLEKWAGRWCDRLIVINQDDRDAALIHRIVPSRHLHYTPGIGVDLSHYSEQSVTEADRFQTRTELGLKPEDVLFLAIAELIPRKRPKDLLLALAKLQRPTAHLALAGEGPLTPELKALAAQLGIAEQVHFLGFRPDIPRFIYTATAVLLVSEQEGLPRSIMEAMAMGVPAIGTRIRGTEDLLKEGAGKLVEVGDSTAIAAEMSWILDNPEAARMLGLQGRQQIQRYDLYEILSLHDGIYADVLEEVA